MSSTYASAAALRAALDSRLLDEATRLGRDPNWIRRRFAFARLLARLVHDDRDAWVLKGGMAVELRRPGLARATRDLDPVLRPGLAGPHPINETSISPSCGPRGPEIEALRNDDDLVILRGNPEFEALFAVS